MALTVISISADILGSELNQEDRNYIENYDYNNYNIGEDNRNGLFVKCIINGAITIIAMTVLFFIAYYFGNHFSHEDYDIYYSILILLLILICTTIILLVIIGTFVKKFKR